MTFSIKKKSSIFWKTGLTEDQIYSRVQSLGDEVCDWEVCPVGDARNAVQLSEFDKLKEDLTAKKNEKLNNSVPQITEHNIHISPHANYHGIKNQTLAKLMLASIILSIFSAIISRNSENILGFAISIYVISIVSNLVLTVWAIVRLWNIDSMFGIYENHKTLSQESKTKSNCCDPFDTIEDKLRNLKKLHEEGLLTDESYAKLNLDLAKKLI
jgi:hypothetical protein